MRRNSVKVAGLDIAARAAGSMNWFATFQAFHYKEYEGLRDQPVDFRVLVLRERSVRVDRATRDY